MRWSLLLSLALLMILAPSAMALEIRGNGEGFFVSEAHNAAGFQAEAWVKSVNGDVHIKADPSAEAEADHAEASVKGFASIDNGYVESGTLSTNDLTQTGSGTITKASITGSGTIGMDYLDSVDMDKSHQSASVNSANVNAYVNTNLSLNEGKASIDSMARDETGNYARVVALGGPSAWIGATQTVSIDPTSTSAAMDIFGTNNQEAHDVQDPPPYVSAYAASGNMLGNTSVQYTISQGHLNTDGVVWDALVGYIVPRIPSASSMYAYADSQQSKVNLEGAGNGVGKINIAQSDIAAVSSQAAIYNMPDNMAESSKLIFLFGNMEGELTGTATQNGVVKSVSIN
ncbi:MAG: hypothetical protein ACE14P_14255 [Methanotrichaceae archaeon]